MNKTVAIGDARSWLTWGLEIATWPPREAILPPGSVSANSGNGEAPKPHAQAEPSHARGYSSTRRRISASHLGSKIMAKHDSTAGSQPVAAQPMPQDFDAPGETYLGRPDGAFASSVPVSIASNDPVDPRSVSPWDPERLSCRNPELDAPSVHIAS